MNRLPVTIDIRAVPDALLIAERAIACHARPRRWRESEYVMTKTTADRVVKQLREAGGGPVEAEYFDVSCLMGELARLYKRCKKEAIKLGADHPRFRGLVDTGADAFAIFARLIRVCNQNPAVVQVEAQALAYEKQKRRLERAQRKVERMEQQYRQQEAEFSTAWQRRNGPGSGDGEAFQMGPVVRRE